MAKKKATVKKLDPIKVKISEKTVKTGDVLTVMVEDDYPQQYNEASAIVKEAEALMLGLKTAMNPTALDHIFEHNERKPFEPIASVAFQDEKGNVTRVSLANKYLDFSAKTAEELFDGIKSKDGKSVDINDYLARVVTATFDSSVFTDVEGRFDQKRYDKITEALDKVCKELGVPNPLSTSVSIKPLPSFATRRWNDFNAPTNKLISSTLQAKPTFTPCPNAKTGKMAGEEDDAPAKNE